MGRSIQVTDRGTRQLKKALRDRRWQQKDLILETGLSRQTISKLLNGRSVYWATLQAACSALGIAIAEIPITEVSDAPRDPNTAATAPRSSLTPQVDPWRAAVAADIQHRCGTMRVLDMERPITLGSIYTPVNVLEKLTANQRCEVDELLDQLGDSTQIQGFDRLGLTRVRQTRVPGLTAVARNPALMVLGKPGAGKTTFLKSVAIACIAGEFMGDRVPTVVTLKEFAEAPGQPSLMDFMAEQWAASGIPAAQTAVRDGLQAGRVLVLLDGLDEVRSASDDRVIREIRQLAERYATAAIVVTCRIAAKPYVFQGFVEVEIADFGDRQIREFVTQWFTHHQDVPKIQALLDRLQDHKPIQELATSPLLLTLLCLVFGEQGDLPRNRAELYREGIDLLLKKWDGKRNIHRDEIYQHLSNNRKEALLGQLALATFGDGNYFFKQAIAEDHIAHYISHLPDAHADPAALRLDSEAVLKAIEAQHGLLVERARGIYSFSHLTFHEYFTAQEIAANQAWDILASHFTNPSWREVILLTLSATRHGDTLIGCLKCHIDHLLAGDPKLQAFLHWLHTKSQPPRAALRAFYLALHLDLELAQTMTRSHARALALDHAHALDLGLGRTYALDLALALTLALALARSQAQSRALALDLDHARALALERSRLLTHELGELALIRALGELERQIEPCQGLRDWPAQRAWWATHGSGWTQRLRQVLIQHRNLGHDWQFTPHQRQHLRQYYDANVLLAQGLQGDCYVSRAVRQTVEQTLFLPIAPREPQRVAGSPLAPQHLG